MTETIAKSASFYVGFNGVFRGVLVLLLVAVEYSVKPSLQNAGAKAHLSVREELTLWPYLALLKGGL